MQDATHRRTRTTTGHKRRQTTPHNRVRHHRAGPRAQPTHHHDQHDPQQAKRSTAKATRRAHEAGDCDTGHRARDQTRARRRTAGDAATTATTPGLDMAGEYLGTRAHPRTPLHCHRHARAKRLLAGHIAELPSNRNDHRLVGETLSLNTRTWNASDRHKRRRPIPLPWALPTHQTDNFLQVRATAMDQWTPQHTRAEVTQMVQTAMALGRGRARPHQMARQISLEKQLQDAVRTANADGERRRARRELQAAHNTIGKEKQAAQHEFVLQNICAGGWGKQDLAPKLHDMPYLSDGNMKIYETTTIARRAKEHYTTIFGEARNPELLDGPSAMGESTLEEKLTQP